MNHFNFGAAAVINNTKKKTLNHVHERRNTHKHKRTLAQLERANS